MPGALKDLQHVEWGPIKTPRYQRDQYRNCSRGINANQGAGSFERADHIRILREDHQMTPDGSVLEMP